MIDVHDVVADFQIAKVGKKRRGARPPLLLALNRGDATFQCRLGSFIKQIGLDVNDEARRRKFESPGEFSKGDYCIDCRRF